MTTLTVLLPSAYPLVEGMPYDYPWTLTGTQAAVSAPGQPAPLTGLPRMRSLTLLVPADRLSWHRLDLPRAPSGRLRQALWGMLEEGLLDGEQSLHFALSPQARAGLPAWVAVCDKAWLAAQIALFEQAGYTAIDVAPLLPPAPIPTDTAAPAPPQTLWIQSGQDRPRAHFNGHDGVISLYLEDAPAGWRSQVQAGQVHFAADPDAAEPAHAWAGLAAQVHTLEAQMRLAAGSGWNLAQFDLSRRHRDAPHAVLARGLRAVALAPGWRACRYGVAAVLGLQVLGMNVWAWQARTRLADDQAAAIAELQQVFPATHLVVDAPAQLQQGVQRLRRQAGIPGVGDLPAVLQALAGAWPASVRVDALDYDDATLVVGARLGEQEQSAVLAALARAGYSARVEADRQGRHLTLSPSASVSGDAP